MRWLGHLVRNGISLILGQKPRNKDGFSKWTVVTFNRRPFWRREAAREKAPFPPP